MRIQYTLPETYLNPTKPDSISLKHPNYVRGSYLKAAPITKNVRVVGRLPDNLAPGFVVLDVGAAELSCAIVLPIASRVDLACIALTPPRPATHSCTLTYGPHGNNPFTRKQDSRPATSPMERQRHFLFISPCEQRHYI